MFAKFRDEAFLFSALVADAADDDDELGVDEKQRLPFAPHFYGVCLTHDLKRLMAVFEPAETLEQMRQKAPQLPLPLRVRVAATVLNVARYFASGASPLGALVHCDIHHKQVAFVGRSMPRIVLLDLDGVQAGSDAHPFGHGHACVPGRDAVDECTGLCMHVDHYAAFAGADPDLLERRCRHGSHSCAGFAPAFNQWTMAGYLLWELLLRDDVQRRVSGVAAATAAGATADVLAAERLFRQTLVKITDSARAADPTERGSPLDALQMVVTVANQLNVTLPFRPLLDEKSLVNYFFFLFCILLKFNSF